MSESVLDALCSAINSRDARQAAACFTADFTCERPLRPHEGFVGSARVQENWTDLFTRLPDLHAEVLRHISDGAEVWSEWEMRGTDRTGGRRCCAGPSS
jgi:hypothetical protein